ncbi:MAG: biopolymer transporter ExbD [Fuerstiella sp.]|nr:biopolymer transporter ExbD [Fuerstiella sp.]
MPGRSRKFRIGRKKKQTRDSDLDITPMIDVTFLLLIFFMVTSTMQATPDKDIAPAATGQNANANRYLNVDILSPDAASDDNRLLFDGRSVSLDELADELQDRAAGGRLDIMIYAERDARNGFVGEVESVINSIEGEVEYDHAVLDM